MGNANLQTGLTASPLPSSKAEVVLEYDIESEKLLTEEAIISFEIDDWEVEAGKMYTPFGAYYQSFRNRPHFRTG
jgi:hypothetical protein